VTTSDVPHNVSTFRATPAAVAGLSNGVIDASNWSIGLRLQFNEPVIQPLLGPCTGFVTAPCIAYCSVDIYGLTLSYRSFPSRKRNTYGIY
jgi:hypothetical protein